MTIKQRLQQLEKRRDAIHNTPEVIEIWGTREDGSTYVIDTWKKFIEADDIFPREVWRRFVNGELTQQG